MQNKNTWMHLPAIWQEVKAVEPLEQVLIKLAGLHQNYQAPTMFIHPKPDSQDCLTQYKYLRP